jgi:carbonic anhydrase
MVDHSEKWNYAESFLWGNNYPQCNGLLQSPIDIDTEQTIECRTLCNVLPRIKQSKCFINYKNKTISIKFDTGSYTEYEGVLYELKQATIHTPSLHTIDGQKYDLEICLVHKLTDNSTDNAGVVLCCLFEAGPHFGSPEQFISQIIYNIPTEEINYDKEVKVSPDWGGHLLIPKESGYFSYNGSLPFPPCTQVYKTVVYEKIGKIGTTNIDTFKKYLGNTSRPIKDLGNRQVFYTPYLKSALSEKKVFRSSNKYLKCYRENINEKSNNTNPVSDTSEENKSVNLGGFSESIKTKLSNFGLSIIVLLIFINAYYFVKFLFRHFYVQKGIRFIAGKDRIPFETVKTWKLCQGKVLTAKDKVAMKEAAQRAEQALESSAMASGMMGQSGFSQMRGALGQQQSMMQPGLGAQRGMMQPGLGSQRGMMQPGLGAQRGMMQPGLGVQRGMIQPGMRR